MGIIIIIILIIILIILIMVCLNQNFVLQSWHQALPDPESGRDPDSRLCDMLAGLLQCSAVWCVSLQHPWKKVTASLELGCQDSDQYSWKGTHNTRSGAFRSPLAANPWTHICLFEPVCSDWLSSPVLVQLNWTVYHTYRHFTLTDNLHCS